MTMTYCFYFILKNLNTQPLLPHPVDLLQNRQKICISLLQFLAERGILQSPYTSIHSMEAPIMSQNLFAKAYFFGYYYFFGKK